MKHGEISVTYIHHCGDDLAVVNAAKASFDKESMWDHIPGIGVEELNPKDVKLIHYLAKHRHHSPFNHSFITVRVVAPLFVARQLVKHKFMPWNEVSRRYVDDEPEFFFPEHFRWRAENVKQGSGENMEDEQPSCNVRKLFEYATQYALLAYKTALEAGMCPEQARMILPQNMMTTWWWSGTLGACADMLNLRLDPHTQFESRVVANKIQEIIEPLFPVSLPAYLEAK